MNGYSDGHTYNNSSSSNHRSSHNPQHHSNYHDVTAESPRSGAAGFGAKSPSNSNNSKGKQQQQQQQQQQQLSSPVSKKLKKRSSATSMKAAAAAGKRHSRECMYDCVYIYNDITARLFRMDLCATRPQRRSCSQFICELHSSDAGPSMTFASDLCLTTCSCCCSMCDCDCVAHECRCID